MKTPFRLLFKNILLKDQLYVGIQQNKAK